MTKFITEMSKKEILESVGGYINTANVYDMDGQGIAKALEKIGFTITDYHDTGRNGIVITREGIKISTNGFVSQEPVKLVVTSLNMVDCGEQEEIYHM